MKEAKEFKEKADRNGEKLIVLPQVSLPAPPSTTTWRVINDSILLVVSIENDFLRNLPDLHIRENGLERLFDVYKKILPSLGKFLQVSVLCD